ncbi:MAG: MFS transporter [Clostridia bacterium]
MNIINEYVLQWKSFNNNIRAFLIFDLCNRLSIAVYVLYFPRYLIEIGFQEDFYGSLMGVSSMMMAIFAIMAGILSDRIGRKNSLLIGVGISKITYLTRAFFVFVPLLYTSHILDGVFLTLYNATINPFIYENATRENRIHAYSMRDIFMRVSTVLGNSLGGFLPFIILLFLPEQTTVIVYRIIFSISLIIAIFGFWQLSKIKPSKDENLLKTREKASIIKTLKNLPTKDMSFIKKFTAVHATISFGAGTFLPFMNTYFLRKFNAGSDLTGIIFSLANVVVIFGLVYAPTLAKKMGMEKSIIFTRIMSFPLFFIMAFAPSLWIVAIAYMARNTLQQMSNPLKNSFLMDSITRETRASANGVINAFGEGARAIGMFMAGYIIVGLGYEFIFMIALVFYVLSATLFYKFFVFDKKKGLIT